MYTTQATIVTRHLSHLQKANFEFQKQLQVIDDEIEDLQE